MKIAVIGCGAIGLYYGARLQRSGQELHYLMRADFERAKAKGIEVRAPDGDFRLRPVNAHRSPGTIGVCDAVLIGIKTTSNDALPELLGPLVGPGTVLLTLQNGLGNDRLLAELYPQNAVLGGLCFICLNRVAPAVVENFLLGSISIGPRRSEDLERAEAMANLFSAAGLETRLEPRLALSQWKKLVWNVPYNGLSIAAGGVSTDVIMNSPSLLEEAKALMAEVIAGAGALGYEIRPDYADLQVERTWKMGAYKPSSLIDFVGGRQVEVESIWGEPLRQARAAGAKLPKLEMLYAVLRSVCRRA